MNFGQAIAALKEGKRVARAGWNGKGMFLTLQNGQLSFEEYNKRRICLDVGEDIPRSTISGVHVKLFDKIGATGGVVMPYIAMKAADDTLVAGWLASQTDILAEDWGVAE